MICSRRGLAVRETVVKTLKRLLPTAPNRTMFGSLYAGNRGIGGENLSMS